MDRSIVEYFSGHEGYKCGYCNSVDGSYSHGMWAHALTPIDYQNLIDRGWRRSGNYCYKPTMNKACCPLYTIRCEANKFTLSKSQKKLLKKVHKYLSFGDSKKIKSECLENKNGQEMDISQCCREVDIQQVQNIKPMDQSHFEIFDSSKMDADSSSQEVEMGKEESIKPESCHSISHSSFPPKLETDSNSASNNPPCRKAKLIRQERKMQKLLNKGMSPAEAALSLKKKGAEPKSVEDFLNKPFPDKPAHKLEVRLVPACLENPLFQDTLEDSYAIYQKYQVTIHKDTPEECSLKQFIRFLVKNPFQSVDGRSRKQYGSFHQQYLLDGKIIAVGVLDILPYCLSSVYFYYDPDYNFLSLGTYGALREIALTRSFNARDIHLQFYYMGFYIHSCIKMRYKGQFTPSYLLCPEVYNFHPIEKCKSKLDISKYQRLEEDTTKTDMNGAVRLRELKILFNKRQMLYPEYKHFKKNIEDSDEEDDEDQVKEYASLVGQLCYPRILLYRC